MISTELAKKAQGSNSDILPFHQVGEKGHFEDGEMEGRGDVNTKSLKCKLSKTKGKEPPLLFSPPPFKTKQERI